MFSIWVSFNNTLLTNNSIRVVEQVGLEPNPPDCKSSALANYATSPDVIIKTVVYHHLSLWISLSFERVSGYCLNNIRILSFALSDYTNISTSPYNNTQWWGGQESNLRLDKVTVCLNSFLSLL